MQRAFYFVYMNRISALLWYIFMISDEFIDNAEVKTKIQHEKMKESLMCFPTMKKLKSHKLRAQGSRDTIKGTRTKNAFPKERKEA